MRTKKILSLACCLLFAATAAWAHKPLLSVEDNEDGTIYIEASFSDGASGSGHTIRIRDKATGKVLTEKKLPAESSLDLPMPTVPYVVEFDAGPGHSATQDGPFSKQAATEAPSAKPAPEASTPQAAAPATVQQTRTQTVPVPVAPVVLASPAPAGPGMAMAMKMMVTTQIVTAVILAFLLGAVVFWIGYSFGKTRVTKN